MNISDAHCGYSTIILYKPSIIWIYHLELKSGHLTFRKMDVLSSEYVEYVVYIFVREQ